ncbi:hypothetical protein LTR08_004142 [Meristemomyces frigidus]|nr:hypothetical protein LTR08_004142 [Meristemomyces frigidus]
MFLSGILSAAAVLPAALALQSGVYLHYPDCVNGPELLTSNLVCDASATPAARAAAIIGAMNITEKLANLIDRSNGSVRLGLPAYEWWQEALHGVANSPGVNFSNSGAFSYATSFPVPLLFSAAFDDKLVLDIATVISTEARAFSNAERTGLDFFTPNINPYKDPRWGRGLETPGEDPLRIQNYVKQLLIGLEDTDDGAFNVTAKPFKKMIATCKHFAAYDMEDWNGDVRYGFDAFMTSQDLAEYYLPPFQTCARDQNVGSVMCSYNAVNGVPSCANEYLMQTILREHWGWTTDNNYVTSDCNAIDNIYANHEYTTSAAAAEGVALTAGCDNSCEAGSHTNVTGAFYGGFVTEDVIDRALRRQYEALVIAGYFDTAASNPYRAIGWDEVNTPSSQTLARDAATMGMTLLKNGGLLPYSFANGTNCTVAMIGMWANGTTQMQGNYAGVAPYLHSPLYAAEQLGINYIYANGPINESTPTGNWTTAAITAAEQADIVLYFGGIDNTIEAESMDRYQIAWPESQQALIASICGLGKPCAIVQLGSMLDDTPLLKNDNVSAIIWAGYPGQDGGVAAFDIITGAVAPAGRLPVTMYPADYVNQVPMTNMSLRPGPGNPGRTYKWYDDAVLPYGFGLSYTDFKISFPHGASSYRHGAGSTLTQGGSYNIQTLLSACTAEHPDLCAGPSLPITVTNAGHTTSDFVALAFAHSTAGPKPYPIKSLITYTRMSQVAPGGRNAQTANLPTTLGALARRDLNGDLILHPGQYEMLVDVPTQATLSFHLTGQAAKLEAWPQPLADQQYNAVKDCPLVGACHDQPIIKREARTF